MKEVSTLFTATIWRVFSSMQISHVLLSYDEFFRHACKCEIKKNSSKPSLLTCSASASSSIEMMLKTDAATPTQQLSLETYLWRRFKSATLNVLVAVLLFTLWTFIAVSLFFPFMFFLFICKYLLHWEKDCWLTVLTTR